MLVIQRSQSHRRRLGQTPYQNKVLSLGPIA